MTPQTAVISAYALVAVLLWGYAALLALERFRQWRSSADAPPPAGNARK